MTSTTSCSEKQTKSKILECGACQSEVAADHLGIQCVQGHHFCVDCSQNIVRMFLFEPQSWIPLKCVTCNVALNESVFERQLKPEQIDLYQKNMLAFSWAKQLVKENEELVYCPFCSYAEIRNKDDIHFMYCPHPDCGKRSCLICRGELPNFQENYDYPDNEEEYEIKMITLSKHFKCTELKNEKKLLDDTLEQGQKLPCPNCGLSGMKDEQCTHMICPNCSQQWCYFCGKTLEDCDKETRYGTIYDHNVNWECNPLRCPMYFTQIGDIDDRWPDTEEDCLFLFHRKRSLRLLRNIYEQWGEEKFNALNAHFHSIDSSGFTMDEIKNEDLQLIVYPNFS
ncbi:unnamed protein product [Didymodactylos carnosus]|uniref:RING-type domain-containing protein n=1 Tax=Didymodactylos carnosus TaxID=1234261 RepID=A0A815BAP6_9BILA|nr:unnamed protein product [Didymodactylos carnosus]CAF1265112.1 unnamed protein product [Didymodactylos carnosus]CAF3823776.1 unnamed protein product [Didymodactylos carnosus]CAF4047118.1 unnamed protein product [Didymodactylos carnosus]